MLMDEHAIAPHPQKLYLRTACSNPGVAAKLEQERRMRDSLSGHKTGLPKKLLDLFNPLPPVETKLPVHRRKPKLPYSGVGQYVDLFAAPGVHPAASALASKRVAAPDGLLLCLLKGTDCKRKGMLPHSGGLQER